MSGEFSQYDFPSPPFTGSTEGPTDIIQMIFSQAGIAGLAAFGLGFVLVGLWSLIFGLWSLV